MNKVKRYLTQLLLGLVTLTIMNCVDTETLPNLFKEPVDTLKDLNCTSSIKSWETFFSEQVIGKADSTFISRLCVNLDRFEFDFSTLPTVRNSNLLIAGFIKYLVCQPGYNIKSLKILGASNCIKPINIFPEGISKLTNLKVLLLENHEIPCLPSKIHSLTCLEKLSLSHNKLKKFPGVLSQLASLKFLKLQHNSIEEFAPKEDIFPCLIKLWLSHNSLCRLPNHLNINFPQLESLVLNNIYLKELPSGLINRLHNLKRVYLNNNKLTRLPITSFSILKKLNGLSLKSNPWIQKDQTNCVRVYIQDIIKQIVDNPVSKHEMLSLYELSARCLVDNYDDLNSKQQNETDMLIDKDARPNLMKSFPYYFSEGDSIVCWLKLRQGCYPFYLDYKLNSASSIAFMLEDLERIKNIAGLSSEIEFYKLIL